MIKKLIAVVCFTLVLFLPKTAAAIDQTNYPEYIEKFESEITVNPDSSINITETISYHTDSHKHGIFRYIPENLKRDGFRYKTPIKIISITNKEGENYPFTQYRENGNVVLKIGDSDTTFTGDRIYVISYTVQDALYQKGGELYWDITGEGWQFPILLTEAKVDVNGREIEDIGCFSGAIGGNDRLCKFTQTDDEVSFSYTEEINYNKNLTIAVKFIPLSPGKPEYLKFVSDNLPLFVLPLPVVGMFCLWYKKGRDWVFDDNNPFDTNPNRAKHLKGLFEKLNVPLVYEPLKLTPGQVGGVFDEVVSTSEVVSDIVYLASLGLIKITKTEKTGLFDRANNYEFEKLKAAPAGLAKHLDYLFKELFSTGDKVSLSSLRGKFYSKFQKAKTMIHESLVDKKLFTANPTKTRIMWIVMVMVLNSLILVLSSNYLFFIANFWVFMFVVLFAITSIFIAWNMPQKTAVGTNYMLQAKGLKNTLNLGKWRDEVKEKHLFIEQIIPYSIALGVLDKLSRDMEELKIAPPDYLNGINTHGFVHSINTMSNSVGSSLSHNPSSSGSGSSGFSGGSSGGGGGGGGGGSW